MTKSAQFPFSSWLPAAIAAPTPVSSLVHSSTLVTAGVYLLFRFNFLLLESNSYFLSVFSLVTIVLAGGCAIFEKDFKKVVAISTLRQLGFIIYCVSCGYWLLSFLHVIFHAFFKRCLFLSTGRLMHLLLGDQDSRNFGALGVSFFSKLLFSMRVLSLIGFPFSLGFYSKDSLIGLFSMSHFNSFSLLFFLGCCLSVCYSFRLLKIAFFRFSSFTVVVGFEEKYHFILPIMILVFLCVSCGNFFF
jgi:NADH-ubiquinone oxidoreductase chain 5